MDMMFLRRSVKTQHLFLEFTLTNDQERLVVSLSKLWAEGLLKLDVTGYIRQAAWPYVHAGESSLAFGIRSWIGWLANPLEEWVVLSGKLHFLVGELYLDRESIHKKTRPSTGCCTVSGRSGETSDLPENTKRI
jgi:hypothetical protein